MICKDLMEYIAFGQIVIVYYLQVGHLLILLRNTSKIKVKDVKGIQI